MTDTRYKRGSGRHTFEAETRLHQEFCSGPPDRSQYRNGFGEWKARQKPHLVRLGMHGKWLCKATVGQQGYNTIGDSALEACTRMPAEPCDHTIGLRFDYSSTDVWCLSEVDDRPHAVEEMRSEVERARLRGARTATQLRGTYQDLVAGVQAEVAAMTPLQVFEAACQVFRHCPDCGASLAHLWAPQPPETARRRER